MRRCSPPSEYLASIVVLAGRIAGVEPHTGGPTPPQELPFRVIYMPTGTGKLNGLDPELYLRQVVRTGCRPARELHRQTAALEPGGRRSRRTYPLLNKCPLQNKWTLN